MKQRKHTRWGNAVTFADTETSGLDPENDRIIQIAVARVVHNLDNPLQIAIQEEFEIKLDMTGYHVPAEVAELNGYDEEVWEREAVDRRKAMRKVMHYFEDSALGGNNPTFDKRFLDAEMKRHGLEWPRLAHYRLWSVDALAIPLHLLGYVQNVKLATLVEFFQLGEQEHDALSDVRHSVRVYQRLLWVHVRGLTDEIVQEAIDLEDNE